MSDEKAPEQHGIQLNFVGVKEIHFDSMKLPKAITDQEIDDTELTSGRSDYDCERHTITVLVKAEVKTKSDNMHLRVELVAEFRVDEAAFPVEKVEDWAQKQGMFILMPYLREHIFSVCTRVGMNPIILPMMVLPPYRIIVPEGIAEDQEPASALVEP